MAKNIIAFLFLSRQIKYKEKPIRKNIIIQTSPIIEPGGVKDGFLIKTYQSLTEDLVKNEPIIPASWQIIKEAANLNVVLILIMFLCPPNL